MLSWDSSTIFTISGLYWFVLVCLVVSGVSQSLRAGRLKMMSTKKRCEENHRPRIGKQRRKKTLESKGEKKMLWNAYEVWKFFLSKSDISRKKTPRDLCFTWALKKLQVQEQDSIFGKFAAAVSCGASRLPLHTSREMVLRTSCLKRGDEQEPLLSSTQYINISYINYTLTMINNLSLLTLYIFTLYNMYPVSLSHRLKSLCKLVRCKHVKLFNEMMVTETIF